MIIGIDVDGVIVDLYSWLEKRMKKYSKNLHGKRVYIKNGKHIYERYGLDRQQDENFWEENIWQYSEDVKTFRDVKKYFNKLKKDGHTLYIVTSRYHAGKENEDGERMRKLIEKSLNGLHYDKIIYTSEMGGKKTACINSGVQILIDDSSWNIEELSPFIDCLLMKTKYNGWLKGNNIICCKNWKEIYKTIQNLSKREGKVE